MRIFKNCLPFILLFGGLLLGGACQRDQRIDVQMTAATPSPRELRNQPVTTREKSDDDVDSVKEGLEKTGDGFEKAGKEMEKGFKKAGSEIKDFFVGDDDKKDK